jgi:beta-lactamase regulating signal transducer with metallopeptidase domain
MIAGHMLLQEWVVRILAAGLNGLWQGGVLFVAVFFLLRGARNVNAATRCLIWSATLALIAVLPFLASLPVEVPAVHRHLVEVPAAAAPAASAPIFTRPVLAISAATICLILAAWFLVAVVKLAAIVRSASYLSRLKRRARPVPARVDAVFERMKETACGSRGRGVSLRASRELGAPVLAGFRDPVILIPQLLLDALLPEELDQVILHELGHFARRDDWSRLVQKVVEALYFFHPAVAWIGRILDLEREIACDDRVLVATGSPRAYAACLTKVMEMSRWTGSPALSPGAIRGRSQLYRRVEMLMNRKRILSLSFSAPALALGLGAVALLALLLHGTSLLGVSVTERPEHQSAANRLAQAHAQMKRAEAEMRKAASEKEQSVARSAKQGQEDLEAARDSMERAKEEMLKAREQMELARDSRQRADEMMADALRDRIEGSFPDAVEEGVQGALDEDQLREYVEEVTRQAIKKTGPMKVDIPAIDIEIPAMDIRIDGKSIHRDKVTVHVPPIHVRVPSVPAPPAPAAAPPAPHAAPAAPAAPPSAPEPPQPPEEPDQD